MASRPDLREFLRSRRARVEPTDVGLPPGLGVRRVPGLRREEIAMLAGVSVDYYVRLEQGRDVNASDEVLAAIARALRLDDDERDHLFDLARPGRPRRRPTTAVPSPRVRPALRTLIDAMEAPAFVLGPRMDVLATNAATRALVCDFDALPREERNMARWFFLRPEARERYRDWDVVGRENVAILRMDAGRNPDDPELRRLVGELSIGSPEFAAWWADHDVLRRNHGTKRYLHPEVGEVTIDFECLNLPEDPELVLVAYTVEPGSPSEEALRQLTGRTVGPLADPAGLPGRAG